MILEVSLAKKLCSGIIWIRFVHGSLHVSFSQKVLIFNGVKYITGILSSTFISFSELNHNWKISTHFKLAGAPSQQSRGTSSGMVLRIRPLTAICPKSPSLLLTKNMCVSTHMDYPLVLFLAHSEVNIGFTCPLIPSGFYFTILQHVKRNII